MIRAACFLALVSVLAATDSYAAPPLDALKIEANTRNDALVKQGYNLTHGFSFKATATTSIDRYALQVPEQSPHTFTLWVATNEGSVELRLRNPDGSSRASLSSERGEVTVSFETTPGTYVVEIERAPVTSGRVLIGVKGPALHRCELAETATEHPAVDAKGFHWPYLLVVPSVVTSKHLLVRPNNTGFETVDLELLRASASCELAQASVLAQKLGAPLLMPLFPRPPEVYLHALTRASLETKVEANRRVDLQLLAMIDEVRQSLADKGLVLDEKVLLEGFSASGSFVDRFTLLHPERVLAVAVGSPGGWPTAPVQRLGAVPLPYPVGLGELEALTGQPVAVERLKLVSWFFFLGDHDENDAVVYRDSFSKADEVLITQRFGAKPVARWPAAEKLSRAAGLNARFKLYSGVAHSVSPEMEADLEAFFRRALSASTQNTGNLGH